MTANDRILSQCGRVIAADFRPRETFEIPLKFDILYIDIFVCLARCTIGNSTIHLAADMITGKVTSI